METVLETLMTMTRKSAMVVAPFQKTVQSPQNVGFLKNIFFSYMFVLGDLGLQNNDDQLEDWGGSLNHCVIITIPIAEHSCQIYRFD